MNSNAKIYVAGHQGMVGSSICRKLHENGHFNIITSTSSDLDLRNQKEVNDFFLATKPEYVFIAAAKVGGIHANNTFKAEFIYDNLMIGANIIHASYINNVNKLLFLGSSSIYPRFATQPMKECSLLEGSLEPTNEGYAIAKIAGIKLCDTYRYQYGCNFISAVPTNLFGFNDNYDLETGHVLPMLIRRFHEAKLNKCPNVVVWGSGNSLREFMFADDVADACIFLMNNYNSPGWINVGTGQEISIRDLTFLIKDVTGFDGDLIFDTSKPDGVSRKLLDITRLHEIGFSHSTSLKDGIKRVYLDFCEKIFPSLDM